MRHTRQCMSSGFVKSNSEFEFNFVRCFQRRSMQSLVHSAACCAATCSISMVASAHCTRSTCCQFCRGDWWHWPAQPTKSWCSSSCWSPGFSSDCASVCPVRRRQSIHRKSRIHHFAGGFRCWHRSQLASAFYSFTCWVISFRWVRRPPPHSVEFTNSILTFISTPR